jgi:hypothetical protein
VQSLCYIWDTFWEAFLHLQHWFSFVLLLAYGVSVSIWGIKVEHVSLKYHELMLKTSSSTMLNPSQWIAHLCSAYSWFFSMLLFVVVVAERPGQVAYLTCYWPIFNLATNLKTFLLMNAAHLTVNIYRLYAEKFPTF